MNRLEERSANDLRRQIVRQRREMLVLNAEFNRLRNARAGAPAEARDLLLVELDAVAERHFEASSTLDSLTDELIRLDRGCQARSDRWRRPWRAVPVR
ncbi:MAG: hypothetical protein ACT4QF_09440 [Sporichthyaceae bacterium]|jgi:hypothetical protein